MERTSDFLNSHATTHPSFCKVRCARPAGLSRQDCNSVKWVLDKIEALCQAAPLLTQLQVPVWLRPEALECWPALRTSQPESESEHTRSAVKVGFWEMLRHIPQNRTVFSNTGNMVTRQTFRSKDEVQ